MTANQLKYLELQEAQRHNVEDERRKEAERQSQIGKDYAEYGLVFDSKTGKQINHVDFRNAFNDSLKGRSIRAEEEKARASTETARGKQYSGETGNLIKMVKNIARAISGKNKDKEEYVKYE